MLYSKTILASILLYCGICAIEILDYSYLTGYDRCIWGESSVALSCFYVRKIYIVINIGVLSYIFSKYLAGNNLSLKINIYLAGVSFLFCWGLVFLIFIIYSSNNTNPLSFDKFIRFRISTFLELFIPLYVIALFLMVSMRNQNCHRRSIDLGKYQRNLFKLIIALIVISLLWYNVKDFVRGFYYFDLISQCCLLTFGVHLPMFLAFSIIIMQFFKKKLNG